MFAKNLISFLLQSVFLQRGCQCPSLRIESVLATKKKVAGKPCPLRMGRACSNWHRSPSSNVSETSVCMIFSELPVGSVESSGLRKEQYMQLRRQISNHKSPTHQKHLSRKDEALSHRRGVGFCGSAGYQFCAEQSNRIFRNLVFGTGSCRLAQP
jgi:hypothetical protein